MKLDYLVIGAGPTGLLIHKELSAYEKGLVIESGNYIKDKTENVYTSEQLLKGYKNKGINFLIGNPSVLLSEGNCVGGGSSLNSSLHHRTPDYVWAKWKLKYGILDLKKEEIDSLYSEIENRFQLSYTKRDMPLFYKYASLKYRVKKIPRWGTDNENYFKRTTAVDVIRREKPILLSSIKEGYHVTNIKYISQSKILIRGYIANKEEDIKSQKGLNKFELRTKKLFICAGAGSSPILLSKLGYRHIKLGKFQIHPTARISLIPKERNLSNEIVDPFQITEFFPYLMIGSSANREYLSKLNFPLRSNKNIDFSSCINLYSMAPSEKEGVINLKFPFNGLRTYFLSKDARDRIKRGLKIITNIASESNLFKYAYSSSGIINLNDINQKSLNNFLEGTISSSLCSVHIFSSAAAGKNKTICPINSDGSVPNYSNVYVMDSSIIPTCPTVNPQSTACLFALSLIRKHIKENVL